MTNTPKTTNEHIRINHHQLAKLFAQPGWLFNGFIIGDRVSWPMENLNQKEMKRSLDCFQFHLGPNENKSVSIFLKK